ncbi:MAG: heme NO-binding domain-containing protein [Spirochaetia bacterium]|nr:heme NO-binding domain-containing protein [Spirochaetia bacterium]
MKGIIFTYLEEFVIKNAGIEAWDTLLETTHLKTEDGVFVSPGNYPDEDLFALVAAGSKNLNLPMNDVIYAFGEFVASKYHQDYTDFFKPGMSAKTLLNSVDKIIHVEVKKLYPDVHLPQFQYEDPAPDKLVMKYFSTRKLCVLAKGLINGVGNLYNEKIEISEPLCMHNGADHCRLELTFVKK